MEINNVLGVKTLNKRFTPIIVQKYEKKLQLVIFMGKKSVIRIDINYNICRLCTQ